MRLITNAVIYRANLPVSSDLAGHLQNHSFIPVLESHVASNGFITFTEDKRWILDFPGGCMFRFRRDAKAFSMKALRLAQDEQISTKEKELGRVLAEDEAAEIKEEIYTETVKSTLPDRTELYIFYHIESKTLIIPTTNKKLASIVVGVLVEACGAIETSSIHISDIKSGLTTRLHNYFIDESKEAFNGFTIGDSVVMKGDAGKASFDLDNLGGGKN